ncbi:hypothetical protein LZ31DRAFT_593316 [Colletotrichum somersetense]|nr:hypothetical protein LZ31DRAFT_593316 [Colletotrichum somersetense]
MGSLLEWIASMIVGMVDQFALQQGQRIFEVQVRDSGFRDRPRFRFWSYLLGLAVHHVFSILIDTLLDALWLEPTMI